MAARTWPKAWHGVLHDSEQDSGVGVVGKRELAERVEPHVRRILAQGIADAYDTIESLSVAEQKQCEVKNGTIEVALGQKAVTCLLVCAGMRLHQHTPFKHLSTKPRTKHTQRRLAPEHATDTTAQCVTCSYP
jgi:hypothetical protein